MADAAIWSCTFFTERYTIVSRGIVSLVPKTSFARSFAYTCVETKLTGTLLSCTCFRKSGTHAACAVAGPPMRSRGETALIARAVWSYRSQ